jgi:hypothetical protein
MKQILSLTLIIMAAMFVLTWRQDKASAANNNLDWSEPRQLSIAPQGATGPKLATSKNGQLLLVYIHRAASGDAPYYHLSTDNGVNWTEGESIYTSNTNSVQVDATFDHNNAIHAVWVEDESEIRHARQGSQGQWIGSSISTAVLPPLGDPKIVATSPGRLDVIWVQNVGSNADIYHASNSGSGWSSPAPINVTNRTSLRPDIAVDHTGKLHVVWAETKGVGAQEIVYVQGTISGGGTVSWTERIVISDAGLEDTYNPRVLIHNKVVNVFFTYRKAHDEQYIRRMTCVANCTDTGNWNQQSISGTKLGANTAGPFYLASAAIAHQGCLYSYYHGTSDQYGGNNEIIWGTNSCAGWAGSAPDMVTAQNHRSMFPTLASQGPWLYLAYESGTEGGQRQIEFRRVLIEAKLYLPVVFKN